MTYLMWGFAFALGIVIGILLEKWKSHRGRYSGTILVTESEEKTLYSLELEDYPENLKFKKEVVFKVDASELSQSQAKHGI